MKKMILILLLLCIDTTFAQNSGAPTLPPFLPPPVLPTNTPIPIANTPGPAKRTYRTMLDLYRYGLQLKGEEVGSYFKVVQKVGSGNYVVEITFPSPEMEPHFYYLEKCDGEDKDHEYVDGQVIQITARVVGTYTYQTVTGSESTVIDLKKTGNINNGFASRCAANDLPAGDTSATNNNTHEQASKQLETGESISYEAENYINGLVDYTQTKCMPAGGKGGALSFLALSSEPVLSIPKSKKAWLLCVVASFGKILNENPSVKVDELCFSDVEHMRDRVVYKLPASLAKSLQSQAYNDQLDLDVMYEQIRKNLVKKVITKGEGEH